MAALTRFGQRSTCQRSQWRKPAKALRQHKPMLEVLEDRVNLSPLPIPQHYTNIRLVERANDPVVLGSPEDDLLKNSVDMVIRDVAPYMGYDPANPDLVYQQAPATPQLLYTNFSDLAWEDSKH